MSIALQQASRAYNRVNDPAALNSEATRAQRSNNKQRMTPELRLLQDHYKLLGEQDAKHVEALDPSRHAFGCRCPRCDKTPQTCSIALCDTVTLGQRALGVHLQWHARQEKKEREMLTELTKSGALSLLKALVGDPKRAQHLDLRAIIEFDKALAATRVGFGKKRMRTRQTMRSLRAAIALYDENPRKLHKLQGQYPADVATLITRLALLCGAGVSSVTSALTLYGLGALAEALRATKTAPIPHVGGDLVAPESMPEQSAYFPSVE